MANGHRYGGQTSSDTGTSESWASPGKQTLTGRIQRKANGTPTDLSPGAGLLGPVDPAALTPAMPALSSDVSYVDSLLTAPVQRHGAGASDAGDAQVHELAAAGTAGAGGPLPFLDQIQASFGAHDVSGVQSHADGAAGAAATGMGATAFAAGNHVAFAGSPDLHTAAHEAAHVVQQRAGVHLKGGVGAEGDVYERHADAVADAVVRGESAQELLGPASGAAAGAAIQRKTAVEEPMAHHGKGAGTELLANATETIQVAIVDCHALIEHKGAGEAALGSTIHYIHTLIHELPPPQRAQLRAKVEALSSAVRMAVDGKKLAWSRVDDAMGPMRLLVGLPEAFHGAVAKPTDVDEQDHGDDVGNSVLHAIDLAGTLAADANAQLDAPGNKESPSGQAGIVASPLYRVTSQVERIKTEMPTVLPGILKVGKPKVEAAMVHIRKLAKRGGADGGLGFRDLHPRALAVRELFGAIDTDDKAIIDQRVVDQGRLKRGDDGIEEDLGKNADGIENMKDKKQAAEQMLHLLASEAQGMFLEAAAGVRDLAGASLEDDDPESPSFWDILLDIAESVVIAGVGGALVGVAAKKLTEGILKAAIDEMIPTLVSSVVSGLKTGLKGVPADDRNPRGFFAAQDELFTRKATSAHQSVLGMSAKFLDKDVDYAHALLDLRTLLADMNHKHTEMNRLQKAVSLSEFSTALARSKLGKDNQQLEESATLDRRFQKAGKKSRRHHTQYTNDVEVGGVMDIHFGGDLDILYPKHIKITGLKDQLRKKLTTFRVGETSMPKVIYGMLGSGHFAMGVTGDKITKIDADAAALIGLATIASSTRKPYADAKQAGAEEIWTRVQRWDLKDIDD